MDNQNYKKVSNLMIGAVVLAAGRSRRMGEPKLILPWGNHTVIEEVVSTLLIAGIQEIIVVTGGAREHIEAFLCNYQVRFVHNPYFENSEMMVSLQIGIRASPTNLAALMIVLGDQPTMQVNTIQEVVKTFHKTQAKLVIPSYQMRRGHPWLIKKNLWNLLLAMPTESSLRDFLHIYQNEIAYAIVESSTILHDIDTPEDYQHQRPVNE